MLQQTNQQCALSISPAQLNDFVQLFADSVIAVVPLK